MTKSSLQTGLDPMDKCARETVRPAYERLKYLLNFCPGITYSCRPRGYYGTTFTSENVKTHLGYEAPEVFAGSEILDR